MKRLMRLLATSVVVTTVLLSAEVLYAQTGAAKDAKATIAPKAMAIPAPSAGEIADAKLKGLVWVNTGSKVYHKDGQFFGKTKQGKFMTEVDAKKAGFRGAKDGAVTKPKTGDVKK